MVRGIRSNAMTFMVDFSSVAKFIGAGEAMTSSLSNNSNYLDVLIKNAHDEAEVEFNREAAAAAAAGAGIRHMFEWGTQGINRGRSNVKPNPLSERARLWEDVMTGTGTSQTLTYIFKPSVAIVPKPTTRDTGMSQETISMLRDHVFTWKARVLELGEMVHIVPKEAKFLLIPFYNGPPEWAKPSEAARGYSLTKGPVNMQPGATVMGNFTNFWLAFWEGRGSEIMNESVGKQIEMDFFPELESNKAGALGMPSSIQPTVKAEEAKVKREANTKARSRRRTNGSK